MTSSPLAKLHTQNGANHQEVDSHQLVLDYGNPTAEERLAKQGAGLIDLSQVDTFTLEGPDARRFANGMFTNNIRRLQPGEGNRSAMCDDRGLVQGLLDLYCTEDNRFEGVLEGVSAEWFEKRYEMYIVFDDVDMSVSDQAPWVLSLQGPAAADILQKAQLPTPTEPGHHIVGEQGIRIANKDRSGLGGFDMLIPDDQLVDIAQQLIEAGATWMGHTALEALRIAHGRARWPVDGSANCFVHDLSINDEVCNFNKGCYLGQEVINRIDVKGQVNKRLLGIIVQTDEPVPLGSTVFLGDRKMGTVSSSATSDGQSVALAILRKSAWDPGTEVRVKVDDQELLAHVTA